MTSPKGPYQYCAAMVPSARTYQRHNVVVPVINIEVSAGVGAVMHGHGNQAADPARALHRAAGVQAPREGAVQAVGRVQNSDQVRSVMHKAVGVSGLALTTHSRPSCSCHATPCHAGMEARPLPTCVRGNCAVPALCSSIAPMRIAHLFGVAVSAFCLLHSSFYLLPSPPRHGASRALLGCSLGAPMWLA